MRISHTGTGSDAVKELEFQSVIAMEPVSFSEIRSSNDFSTVGKVFFTDAIDRTSLLLVLNSREGISNWPNG